MTLVVENWPPARLKPYERNPRRNDDAVDRMVAAIEEFGFRIPVVARSDGTVVDGHLRLKAALRLGLKKIPVVLADELTPAQVKAFRIAVNRSATWSDWDEELLALEIADLEEEGYDLALTGFDEDEIERLVAAGADHDDGEDRGGEDGGGNTSTTCCPKCGHIFEI